MKLSLTIWTAVADDSGGPTGASFASERAAEDWILNLLDGKATRETLDAWLAANPDAGFFDFAKNHLFDGALDCFTLTSQEIEFEVELPPVRVVVALEGGLVSGASSDGPVDMCVVDYDVECADPGDIVALPQSGNAETEDAYLRGETVDLDPAWVNAVFALDGEAFPDGHERIFMAPSTGEALPGAALAAVDIALHEAAIAEHGIAGALERALGLVTIMTESPPCQHLALGERQPGDVATGDEEITEANVAHLVSDALVLLDAIGWAVVKEDGAVRFLTIPVEGEEGTAWTLTITKETAA